MPSVELKVERDKNNVVLWVDSRTRIMCFLEPIEKIAAKSVFDELGDTKTGIVF